MQDTAVVWYTACDLRTHDHDGLVSAVAAGARVVPMFVFDTDVLAAEGPTAAAHLYYAVADLKSSLRALGSDLVVRMGTSAEHVPAVAAAAAAAAVSHCDSPAAALRAEAAAVRRALGAALPELRLNTWRMRLRGEHPVPDDLFWSYENFDAATRDLPLCAPAAAPLRGALGGLPEGVAAGEMPRIEEVLASACQGPLGAALRDAPPSFGTHTLCRPGFGESSALAMLDRYVMEGELAFGQELFREELKLGTQEGAQEGGVLARPGLESAAVKRIVAAKGVGGLAPGEVFTRAFGMALALGCISPRRLMVARQIGYAPNYWSVQRPLTCWAAAAARAHEWHEVLARRDTLTRVSGSAPPPPFAAKYWRWNGWLCRYAEGGRVGDASAPVLVMVHGFGGSADQWARCFESELRATHRLFAIDLLGFGHSAKPPLTYSQYTWSDCVRDFGLQIVKTPFFVAGNSIGGYTSMGTAADTPGLCQGIVLLNSAGRLLTPADLIAEKKKFGGVTVEEATLTQKLAPYSAPPNAVLSAISTVIFAGLQGRIRQTCKSLYPVRPERVDDGLADNILRDSKDPGALGIFNAGAKLPYSRSANEMLAKFGGPVLVAQGLLDPLNDAKARVKQFQEAYEAVEVVPIQGGHCPQDEMAEEVCAAIADFARKHTQGSQSESASAKQEVVMSNP